MQIHTLWGFIFPHGCVGVSLGALKAPSAGWQEGVLRFNDADEAQVICPLLVSAPVCHSS